MYFCGCRQILNFQLLRAYDSKSDRNRQKSHEINLRKTPALTCYRCWEFDQVVHCGKANIYCLEPLTFLSKESLNASLLISIKIQLLPSFCFSLKLSRKSLKQWRRFPFWFSTDRFVSYVKSILNKIMF